MTLSEATILVVDDEPVLRLTFSVVLRQAGAVVHTAENGLDGLRMLETERFDIILSDKQMPLMDGLTMIRELRTRGISTPVVFFVNGVMSEDPAEMKQLNVVQTVTKPLHPLDLTKVLSNALASLPSR